MDKLSEYKVDYFSKYYFYEEEDFLEKVEDGNYILNQVKENPKAKYQPTPSGLQKLKAHKVYIDEIGRLYDPQKKRNEGM